MKIIFSLFRKYSELEIIDRKDSLVSLNNFGDSSEEDTLVNNFCWKWLAFS